MIFYGTRATQISAQALDIPCPSCGKAEQLGFVVQKYAHIFWVPTFPLKKYRALQCLHCKKVQLDAEMSAQQKAQFAPILAKSSTPKWTFAGLLVIALLIGWGKVSSAREEAQIQSWAQSPVIGDVAAFKDDKDFRVLKVVGVEGGKVQILQSKYAYPSAFDAEHHQNKIGAESDQYFPDLYQMDLTAYRKLEISYVKRP